jgi:predicted lipoprotein
VRRRSRARWAWPGAVVLLLVAIGFATEYRPIDAPQAATQQAFDPAAFAAQTYEPQVVPEIQRSAVDLSVLLPALAQDKEAAGQQYGRRPGTGPYNFAVRGTGVAGNVRSGLLPVTVPGVPDGTQVYVQVGPAINGTALRDSVGFITFGQFLNQVEYADAATALNEAVKQRVLAGLDPAALSGRTVSFVGAFTALTPTTVTITPVELQVQS